MAEGNLIDTNVISELRRREPEPRLVHWFEQRPAGQLYLSVLTLGEIRRGVDKLQQGERQRTLRIWLEQELPTFFAGRVLPIDGAVAHRWGQLMAKLERPLPAIDSLLVATALEHSRTEQGAWPLPDHRTAPSLSGGCTGGHTLLPHQNPSPDCDLPMGG